MTRPSMNKMPIFRKNYLGILVVVTTALAANELSAAEPESQLSLFKRESSPFVVASEESRTAEVFKSPRWRAFVDTLDRELEVPPDRATLESACRKSIHYVTLTSAILLTDECIRQALATVDPAGTYTPPGRFESRERERKRPRGAMGLEFLSKKLEGEPIKVIGVIQGGPAANAGVLADDRIEAVDGVSIFSTGLDDTLDLLRGEPGSTAVVKIERQGQSLELPVRRDVITISSVRTERLDGDVLYVRISRLQRGVTANEFVAKLQRELTATPNRPRLWVLDLRNNLGGSLEETAAVASLFVPPEEAVLKTSSRTEGIKTVTVPASEFRDRISATLTGDSLRAIPVVVLVDGRTASGAEALARLMRERLLARVAGSATADFDNVTKEFNLHNEAAVRVTVGRILNAAGQRWNPGGVPIELPLANTPGAAFGDLSKDSPLAGAVERYLK